tara:strand:+ start:650 stop:1489 length:840 start_codon:yes stop_codon:yes gene_type:complete
MKIYVVNLDRAPKRMAKMREQLTRMNLSFKRIAAVDGKNLNLSQSILNQALFKVTQKRECTLGELGCAESHRLVWEEILSSEEAYSLILEDDIILPENLKSLLHFIEKEAYFDIINLSSTGSYPVTSEKIEYLKSLGLSERPYFKNRKNWKQIEAGRWKIFSIKHNDTFTLLECSVLPPLTSGYIVSNQACLKLLKATKNISYPIDYAFRYVSGPIRQAFTFPANIEQNNKFITSIEGRGTKSNKSYFKLDWFLKNISSKQKLSRKLSLLKLYKFKSVY